MWFWGALILAIVVLLYIVKVDSDTIIAVALTAVATRFLVINKMVEGGGSGGFNSVEEVYAYIRKNSPHEFVNDGQAPAAVFIRNEFANYLENGATSYNGKPLINKLSADLNGKSEVITIMNNMYNHLANHNYIRRGEKKLCKDVDNDTLELLHRIIHNVIDPDVE